MSSVPPFARPLSGSTRDTRSNLGSARSVSISGQRTNFESTYSGLSKAHRVASLFSISSVPRQVDFDSAEAHEAMSVLQKLFLPIILRRVLRARKKERWSSERSLRVYTEDSIVQTFRSSRSLMSNWPVEILRILAEEAVYNYLEPEEIIVYMREWYVSCGIVVLLYGDVYERSTELGSPTSLTEQFYARRQSAPAILCDRVVLCRDASPACIVSRGYADVAIIPARWVWDVISSYVFQLSAESVLDCLRLHIVPMSESIINETYYPMSLVLRRSWLWPLFSPSDRVRLARSMEVRVFCIGDTIFSEGDRDPYMYIIRRGIVKTLVKKEPIIEFDAGGSFGEISIIFDEPRCCHAVATTMCEVYCLHRKHLMKRLRRKPQLCESVVSKALKRREQWLEDGKTRDIMGLAALLSGVPCLSQSTERVRMNLAEAARVHVLPPGVTLFKKDSLCDRLFVIGHGTLAVCGGPDAESLRSTADFVGELCLCPHLWPADVVTRTSVDGWSISAEEIMQALSSIRADAQAVDLCRQGIELYRAQEGDTQARETTENGENGENTEDPPTGERVRPSPPATRAPSIDVLPPRRKRLVTLDAEGTQNAPHTVGSPLLKDEAIVSDFDWNAYAMDDKESSTMAEGNETVRRDDRRHLEQSIEKELSKRAGELLSVSEQERPSAVDYDFPGEVDELQQMLVEQVFLMPTERQPGFLRQINRSKVTIVMDDTLEQGEELSSEITIMNDLTVPQYVVPPPVLYTLDTIADALENNQGPLESLTPLISPRYALDPTIQNSRRRTRTPDLGLLPNWQTPTQRSVEDMLSSTSKSRPHSGASLRSRTVRPSSAFVHKHTPPRTQSAGCNQRMSRSVSFCSRTSVFATLTPTNAPDTTNLSLQNTVSSWAKPNSIDLTQQAKISAAMFQSALDKFVKLDDQNYFQEMVRVCLPPQTAEQWTEEEHNNSTRGKDGLVLLLMHVRRCDGLEIKGRIRSPIVKVSTNSRVLIRTPIMQDRVKPVWPIEVASFISFVRRDSELEFTICDSEDESLIAYTATMSTSELRENGGVGLRSLSMHPNDLSVTCSPSEENAIIEVCMLAVTASKYTSLHKRATDESEDDKLSDDMSTLYLQVLGVEALKHRIEAVIGVSVETDGKTKEILRTPKISPKTRTPFWPGQCSFCVIKSDGLVSFDLYHRDVFLASYDTPADTLAFGGTGIHVFPLTRAQGDNGESYGKLVVSILGMKTPSDEEGVNERTSKVLVLHVDNFKMISSSEEEFTPDPFVIVRGPRGEEILRTPLSLGTYNASWNEEEASCFIVCPALTGSSAIYRVEVYDNNERNKLGTSEFSVTMNGTRRNRMQFSIGDRGTLTVLAHTFPVQKAPRPPKPLRRNSDSFNYEVNNDDFLLLVHVIGCDGLQGTGFDDFQIDPLVTARIGRSRMVVAPLVSGSTAPRWSYPKATLLLPVLPSILSHITLEVWDTNIELCDVLGVARVSIEQLCQTGTHRFTLQPHKDQEFGRRQNLGTITVQSLFGKRNGEVVSGGASLSFSSSGSSHSTGLFESRLFHNAANAPDLPVTRVRVHISSCCALRSTVALKYVRATVSCLQHVLLEVKREWAESGCPAWSLAEAHTVVDLRAIYGRSLRLTVVGCGDDGDVTIGAALLPFSALVSSTPGVVAVRSLPLTDPATQRESISEGQERSRSTSVSVDTPSVTVALFAMDPADLPGVEGD
ncbi:Cyclic nucleotide-binding domain [Trypanosoma melophagium]|uniref:Cyclic nucleotide-binding domain n=1 Tax=Trypanosoma melophagium TaxID=715481 RepID=UPI00351A37C0|nr:Cyclic nucleotide-binding domain [Trypanosoma melophagium]